MDGQPRWRFVFQVTMASRDRPLLVALQNFLGYGCVIDRRPQKPHWQPTSTFSIASIKAHRAATIPFAERYLLPYCAKRSQFEKWKKALDAQDISRPRRQGRLICSVAGCEKFVRGQGVCRSHYYQLTGY
jgi:hypothetical protein